MKNASRVPERKDVPKGDTWNLGPMYRSDAAWERDRKALEGAVAPFAAFQGKLGRSAKMLRTCLDAEYAFRRRLDKLVVYSNLRHMEDVACPKAQGMSLRASFLATRAQEALSFIVPEFNTIPAATVRAWLQGPELAPYAFVIRELLRIRPHVLSPKEELLLAMQGETAETASRVFGQLTDADLRFGSVKDASGKETELTHASMGLFREHPKRSARREAFEKYHQVYEAHGNTLAAAMSGSVAQDVYQARVRRFGSTIEARLFDDKVPVSVFNTLVSTVRAALPTLHRCLEVRRRALRLKDYHIYDNYVPLAPAPGKGQSYDEAVGTVCDAVTPLGDEYVRLLRAGLTADRWVDRYENRNKHSGAFSWGCCDSPPYILMNYRDDVPDSVFTLAHEAGHSMHSLLSRRAQPYHYSAYSILVAEVASTVNEQLLAARLMEKARTKRERLLLVAKEIDEIRFTVFRQTMFAEFERLIHAEAEAGNPLTLARFRELYRGLLEAYFGPDTVIDPWMELEGLRIPHFYGAFYVYKYATGLSSAIALARGLLGAGERERRRYLRFLSLGGSKYPLDQLKEAGVDLTTPQPVAAAMARFKELVEELDALV